MQGRKKVLTVIFTVVAFVLTVSFAHKTNQVLMRKTSWNRMQDLIEGETNKDILFVGTSHVMDAIVPMELWERYGYTSYVLCAEYNDMERNIPMLRLALQYTQPELVVLDIDNYWEKSPEDKTLIGYHEFADAFPLTWEKYVTTRMLYGENKSARREILFPFVLYHNRWNDLSRNDFRDEVSDDFWRGYEFATDSMAVAMADPVSRSDGVLPDVYGVAAIERFIVECKSRGIDVLLMTAPFGASTQEQEYLQGIYEIAERNGVPYVNMLEDPEVINANTDYRDEGHMNISGAVKVTDYIGSYISKQYKITDRKKDESYGTWQEDYEEYRAYIREAIVNEGELERLLILGASDKTDSTVYINIDSEVAEYGPYVALPWHSAVQTETDPKTVKAFRIGALLNNMVSCEKAQPFDWQEETYVKLGYEGDDGSILGRFQPGDIYIAFYDKRTGEPICEKAFRQEADGSGFVECERTE